MKFVPENIGDAVRMYVRVNYRSSKDAARHFGISQGYLSGMMTGVRRPTQKVLDAMGMVLAYVPSDSLDEKAFPFERRQTTESASTSLHASV